MKTILIKNNSHPLPSPLQTISCDRFWCRLRGLMFHSKLAYEEGMLMVGGRDSRIFPSIHMAFVNMDLAVIWINSAYRVVDLLLARAWQTVKRPRQAARYTLEAHPARLDEFTIGDLVEFQHV